MTQADLCSSFMNFINSVKANELLKTALNNFMKYLGFEGFQTSEASIGLGIMSIEVYGFDDRKVFLSVFNEKEILKGRYIICDNSCVTLDSVTFKCDGFDWTEEEGD